MERIEIVSAIVLLCSILECVHGKPPSKYGAPIIKNIGKETIIDAQHNLTLLCEGREKITWTYPNNTILDTYWSTVNIETSESNGKYFAKLTLLNASYVDVDYYYCHAENAAKDEGGRSAKIYVYVRDAEHLSVLSSEELVFLPVNQHSTVILPCRPTSPDIAVNLYDINEDEVQPLSYHNDKGFLISAVTFNANYLCKFQRDEAEEILTLIMTVTTNTEFVPKLYIEAPNNGKTKIGVKYVLNCTVTVEQNVYFSLEWKVPSISGEKTGRINKTVATAVDDGTGQRQGFSSLVIEKIEFEDEGEYTCIIIDHTLKRNSVSKNITVFEPPSKYGAPIIKNVGKETIIDARHNLTLLCEGREKITWTYPNNKILDTYWSIVNIETSESNGKYFAKLVLLNVSYVDVDYYYCHAENAAKDEGGRSAKIYVYVRDAEHLSVLPSDDLVFLTVNQHSTVILPCRPTSPDIAVNLYDINEDEVQPLSYHNDNGFLISVDTFNANYLCKFQRDGAEEVLILIMTVITNTEFVPKPYIEAPNNGKTKIGEKYVLNCTVTVEQNVHFNLEWKIPSISGEKTGRINKTLATAVDDGNGQRQGFSSLIIDKVEFEDEGEYTCIITDHTLKNNSVSKIITVFDESESYIILQEETVMNTIKTTAGSESLQ